MLQVHYGGEFEFPADDWEQNLGGSLQHWADGRKIDRPTRAMREMSKSGGSGVFGGAPSSSRGGRDDDGQRDLPGCSCAEFGFGQKIQKWQGKKRLKPGSHGEFNFNDANPETLRRSLALASSLM